MTGRVLLNVIIIFLIINLITVLKTRVKMLETYHEPKSRYYYLYIGGRIVLLSREEYILLKEVLE